MYMSERAKRALKELGLTDYEARAYLALLNKGTMTASKISEDADLPYSKIYETLNSLDKKGWIEFEEGRPKRYYPKSPTEALDAVKLRFENFMRSWEQFVLGELQPLYEKRGIREKPDIWIVRGEFNVIARLREMLSEVESELMIAIPIFSEGLSEAIYPALTHLSSIGVKILFLASNRVVKKSIKKIAGVAAVRLRDQMFGGGVIADGKEALLLLSEKEEPVIGIFSDHTGLVKFAKDYFRYLWEDATNLAC